MPSAATTLCTACGLCCDGTLFRTVPLGPGEGAPLRSLGLTILQVMGSEQLSQPCAALEGTSCRVYAARPAACRAYSCALLRAVDAGLVPLERAVAVALRDRSVVAALAKEVDLRTVADLVEATSADRDAGPGV